MLKPLAMSQVVSHIFVFYCPAGVLAYLSTQQICDDWVAGLFRPSEVKTSGKAMANYPIKLMPENWVL